MASLNNEYAELQKAHALTNSELSVAHEYKRQFEVFIIYFLFLFYWIILYCSATIYSIFVGS